MFEAKGIDFSQIEDSAAHYEASAPGVGFAAGGGVAKAVEEVIHRIRPEVEVKTVAAEGLDECRKMLRGARTGKYNGYLLEGMACPGGCIAGAGTVQPAERPWPTPWIPPIWRTSIWCTRAATSGTTWSATDAETLRYMPSTSRAAGFRPTGGERYAHQL